MRASRFHLATLKEAPVDAEIISHQLMLRAGMIRRHAAGIYSWLPLGLLILRKVEHIIREEMFFSNMRLRAKDVKCMYLLKETFL